MRPVIYLKVRDWDFVTPLALGDVAARDFDLVVERNSAMPMFSAEKNKFEVCEISFSRHVQAIAAGSTSISAIPYFVMRAFRHRCILTRKDNLLEDLAALSGTRIGLTGWQDSGNTWTRSLLTRSNVNLEEVKWIVGRLTTSEPVMDRLGPYGRPGWIEPVHGEETILDLLEDGRIDAAFAPYLPPSFFSPDSPLRFLLPEWRLAEKRYFDEVGYVPGMHVLGMHAELRRELPWLPGALAAVLEESAQVWLTRRKKIADTSPWIIDELYRASLDLPANWNPAGVENNKAMISDYISHMLDQKLIERKLDAEELFV